MNTRQNHRAWIDKALLSRKADFLKMDQTRELVKTPPKDPKPLQRSLKLPQDDLVQENQDLCLALWQLNIHS
jgi:hypothetical protein